jgi:hypoxanthine-guanine phosphoribosyltransferase
VSKKKTALQKNDELIVGLDGEIRRAQSFSELLADIQGLDSKRKALWIEIYNNAVSDREKACMLFTEAYKSMGTSNTMDDHVNLGTTMSKYLERMSKCNDQILDLANLIAKVEEREQKMDPETLFDKIQSMGD